MIFRQWYDIESSTYTYLLGDERTRVAVLIDPVRENVERDLAQLSELGLTLAYVLDTHTHADHVTAAGTLRERTGAKTVGGQTAAPCASVHMHDGELLKVGDLELRAMATPGHTDDSVSYVVGDRVFTGDALLIRGCGRTDFQNGNAAQLYDSITRKLFALPDETLVFPGHDYRGLTVSTVGEEKRFNTRIKNRTREEFVEVMGALNLPAPKKIQEAVPANRSCGLAQIDPDDLALHASRARVVDVREVDEFEGALCHIPGAELAPLQQLLQRAAGWDKSAPVVLVCRSGRRSAAAAAQLVAEGFKHVFNLRGGMQAYRAAGLPTECGPCPR